MSSLRGTANSVSTHRNVLTNRHPDASTIGVVVDVILDESHPALNDWEFLDIGKDTSYVGAVIFTDVADPYSRDENFAIAIPYNRNFINLPIKNELVEIIRTAGYTYYKTATPLANPNFTAYIKNISTIRPYNKQSSGNIVSKVLGYKSVAKTGIAKSSGASPYNDDEYGKYYEVDKKLHRLKFFEGDHILESRFGQSIRFSGYDNQDKKFYPCITIRNRENDLSKEEKVSGEFILEDINRDGSIMVMSSLKKILPFIPGTVDKSGNTDFKMKPKAWVSGTPNQKNKKFPKPLDGDQVLINSDRIILSSRKNEMIFYSKDNVGLISDAHWSWDLGEGITGEIRGNWHVYTNNHDFRTWNGTRGRNILGSGPNLQHIPRGDDLIDWLSQLIDLILSNIYFINPGPPPQTLPGPMNNRAGYLILKSKLPKLLSRLNFTGNDPTDAGNIP